MHWSQQEEVLIKIKSRQPEFFTGDLLLFFFEMMEGYVYNEFFGHLPLYQPLNKHQERFRQYYVQVEPNPGDMGIGGGSYGEKFEHPAVWNMKQFIGHTRLNVAYKQPITIDDYGYVTMKPGYLEAKHYRPAGKILGVDE